MEKDIKIDRYGNHYYINDGKVILVTNYGEKEVLQRNLFFDKDGDIFIGIGIETCGRGSFATVELCPDEKHCFKVFDCPENENIDPYVLDVMMSEDLPGFYNIINTFYKKDSDKVFLAGYVMDFLPKADMRTFRIGGVDLLEKDSSYILDSYENLCKSMMTLSKRGILLNDTAEYNTSIEDNGLVIYDVDSFKRSDKPVDEIYLKNMRSLNGLMISMICRDILSHHSQENSDELRSYFEEVGNIDTKFDFTEVFKPGEKAIDSLSKYIKNNCKK